MNAELIAVGTELLLGQIANTNARFLSRRFAEMGVNVYCHTVVGDNAGRLAEAIRLAAGRADLVVLTGGLGPTGDDITRDVLAEVTGRGLVTDEAAMAKIRAYFERRQMPMPANNARQALIVEGGEALPNETGMAAGTALEHEGKLYVLLPGPPREMEPMFDRHARPWIERRLNGKRPLFSRMLKFAGIGESALEERLHDLFREQTDPTLALYASEGVVTLRATTRAADAEEADRRMAPVIREIHRRAGGHLYAEEDIGLEEAVVRLMAKKGLTLSVAESCTGGLLGQMITSVPGSSAMFCGGMIVYANDWKTKGLGVPADLLEGPGAPGAVSRETAHAMAERLLRLTGTDVAVSITGVAGPGHSDAKPAGLVYMGLAVRGDLATGLEKGREQRQKGEKGRTEEQTNESATGRAEKQADERAMVRVEVERLNLQGSRDMIRLRAARHALYRLWQLAKERA